MSTERRSCTNSDPQVTRRLLAILVLIIGLLCMFAGYLLGRMARNEAKRSSDLLTINLTTVADKLYTKAKRMSPKTVHHHSEKIQTKFLQIFECSSCCNLDKYNLAEFVRNSINGQVSKLMRCVYNASSYLDSLR